MRNNREARHATEPKSRAALVIRGGMLALGFLLASPFATATDRDTGLARLIGVWQIDHRVSEDPRRILRQANDRFVPREGREKPGSAFEERVRLVTDGVNVLVIAYRDGELTLTDWNDVVQTLRVDGKKRSAERGGLAVQVEAGWKSSDRLVVKTTGTPGGWIRETYELGERGDKLFVTVELQRKGSRFSFSFDRLYHRAVARG